VGITSPHDPRALLCQPQSETVPRWRLIENPLGAQTVAEVLASIEVPDGQTLLTLFESETLLLAVNHEMVSIDHPVTDGDEIGVFPPVTGG